jgi:hypothetical protein
MWSEPAMDKAFVEPKKWEHVAMADAGHCLSDKMIEQRIIFDARRCLSEKGTLQIIGK